MKMRSFALALLLCLLWTCGAQAAQFNAVGLFQITYDDAYFLDDFSYLEDNEQDYRWLFCLIDQETLVDVSLDLSDYYQGISLQDAQEAHRQEYVDDFLAAYRGGTICFEQVFYAGEQKIPFYIYSIEDETGTSYLAETVSHGCAVDFYAYYLDLSRPADEALLEKLTELLASFEPAM